DHEGDGVVLPAAAVDLVEEAGDAARRVGGFELHGEGREIPAVVTGGTGDRRGGHRVGRVDVDGLRVLRLRIAGPVGRVVLEDVAAFAEYDRVGVRPPSRSVQSIQDLLHASRSVRGGQR